MMEQTQSLSLSIYTYKYKIYIYTTNMYTTYMYILLVYILHVMCIYYMCAWYVYIYVCIFMCIYIFRIHKNAIKRHKQKWERIPVSCPLCVFFHHRPPRPKLWMTNHQHCRSSPQRCFSDCYQNEISTENPEQESQDNIQTIEVQLWWRLYLNQSIRTFIPRLSMSPDLTLKDIGLPCSSCAPAD